jgi:fumarate hydratase class II
VELSGQLRTVAVCLTKISNDLRWMNSGPLAGLGEIHLPALQPGSSIMPGKVNPVIPEAVTMASAQVFGNDVTVTVAGQSGNFQLNVMLPVIAHALLQSIELMTNSALSLARTTIDRLRLDEQRIGLTVDRNPMLVTALSPVLGYERAAAIAHSARQQGRPILDVAVELTDLRREDLASLLDPARLTGARMPPREEG